MGAAGWTSMLVAVVAFAAWPAFRTWCLAEAHPPYRALGLKRYVNRLGAVPFMPDQAKAHLQRLHLAVAVSICTLVAILTGVVSARS